MIKVVAPRMAQNVVDRAMQVCLQADFFNFNVPILFHECRKKNRFEEIVSLRDFSARHKNLQVELGSVMLKMFQ